MFFPSGRERFQSQPPASPHRRFVSGVMTVGVFAIKNSFGEHAAAEVFFFFPARFERSLLVLGRVKEAV